MVWYSELFEPPGGDRPKYFERKFRKMAAKYSDQLDHNAMYEEVFQNMCLKLQRLDSPPVEPLTVDFERFVTTIFGRELVSEYRKHYRRSDASTWLLAYGNHGQLTYDLKCKQRLSNADIRKALAERRLPLEKLGDEPLDEALIGDILAQPGWASECREKNESIEDIATGENPTEFQAAGPNPEEASVDAEQAARVAMILGEGATVPGEKPLPLDDKSLAILRLYYQGGMSVQGIAESLGEKHHKVNYNLKKSLKALRGWWGRNS